MGLPVFLYHTDATINMKTNMVSTDTPHLIKMNSFTNVYVCAFFTNVQI